MSTSLLYHAFGVRGYQYLKTAYSKGTTVFTIERNPDKLCCSACGSKDVIRQGSQVRDFHGVPIGSRKVTIKADIPRLQCRQCNKTRQAEIGFALPRRSYTKAFERYALELSRKTTIADVAEHLEVSWDVIKDIQKRNLTKYYARPKLKHLRQIAIDEISIGKGHKYLTVVLDLKKGAVVFVGDGKGAKALLPFWKRLRASHAKIEAVATDMSPAYIEAVTTNLPKATLVFDRFHVTKLYNEKLSQLRRDLYREATDGPMKKSLKGTRWLLLKNPEKLDSQRNERARLEEALRLNQPLALAYYMKEDLRDVWEQEDEEQAEAHLMDWILRAEASGVVMLQKFAKTLRLHAIGILAWYDYPISTGPLEGTNNKIKTMKRQAYGFRDKEFFKLKILSLHRKKYALVG
jgi:transposase